MDRLIVDRVTLVVGQLVTPNVFSECQYLKLYTAGDVVDVARDRPCHRV